MSLSELANNTGLLKQVPTPIALLDSSFNFIGASDQWITKFKFKDKEVLGKSIFQIFPSFSEDWKIKLQYAFDGLKEIKIVDASNLEPNNQTKLIWTLNPWTDPNGNSLGVTLGVKDISEVRKLKIELQKTKNQLNQKSTLAKIGSWEYSVTSKKIKLSPSARSIFKLNSNKHINLNTILALHEIGDTKVTIKNAIKNALKNGTPWNHNFQMTTLDTNKLWVNSIGRPKFTNGKCTRIIGTIQDISDKMLVKDEATNQTNTSDKNVYFEESPTAMLVYDVKNSSIKTINKAFTTLTEKTTKNLQNNTLDNLHSIKSILNKTSVKDELMRTGSFKPIEFNFKPNKATTLTFSITGKYITDVSSNKEIICSIQDVTTSNIQTKQLKQKLNDNNIHVEELVNFAHMISHNLKSHSINFSLLFDFLDVETDEREHKKLISILRHGNIGLSESINGLREIVAIRERNSLKKEHLILSESIYRVEQSLSGVIRKNDVKIINEIPEDLKVNAISPYLDNILNNILSNAIKYKKEFKKPVIVISAEKTAKYTTIAIEDNGIGIDLANNAQKLFKMYSTVGNNLDARGMGLCLTNYQLKLMKGKIEVQSKLGEGSTFKLYFPN